MHNAVTSADLQADAKWTFVHSSGKRTQYIYDREILPGTGGNPPRSLPLDAMHTLRNPATGKFAYVTERWLCGMRWGGSRWIAGGEA